MQMAIYPSASEPENGFTLLELLVAMVVCSLLAAAMFGGLRLGTRIWTTTESKMAAAGEMWAARDLLRDEIAQAYPALLGQDSAKAPIDFDGTRNGLTFLAPLPNNLGSEEIVRLTVHVTNSNGRNALVMSWRLDRAERASKFATERWSDVVLLRRVRKLAFSYYGVDRSEKEPSWRDDWTNKRRLPLLVRADIEFEPGDGRSWPGLLIAPKVSVDASCVYDPVSRSCRGQE